MTVAVPVSIGDFPGSPDNQDTLFAGPTTFFLTMRSDPHLFEVLSQEIPTIFWIAMVNEEPHDVLGIDG